MYKRATSEGCVAYLRLVQLPSRLIEAAVDQMATLPGVGRRTALRLVLNMLARDEERVRDFADAMVAMREGVKPCTVCHNPTEEEVCNLCANPHVTPPRYAWWKTLGTSSPWKAWANTEGCTTCWAG